MGRGQGDDSEEKDSGPDAARYSERMTAPPASRRPLLITLVVVLAALNGIGSALVGTLILLSRYDVPADDVLAVSLIGAAVILFGLLTLAIAGGIGRGSRLARLLASLYLGAQLLLGVLTFTLTDWDWWGVVGIALDLLTLLALWLPPGARYFARPARAADPG